MIEHLLLGPLSFAVLVIGDAAAAAAIAGLFSVINTGLTAILLRYASRTRSDVRAAHTSVSHAAVSALSAAEASLEAARVAKSIGSKLRHEDRLEVHRESPKPELEQ